MRAFDLPSLAGVNGAFVLPPRRAFATGAQDGCVIDHDVHPAGRSALGQALRQSARYRLPVAELSRGVSRFPAGQRTTS